MNQFNYTTQTLQDLEKNLSSSIKSGLTKQQVVDKQKEFGPNMIKQNSVTWFGLFLRQFNSSFTYLLMGAAIISFFLGDKINSIIIILIILINGLLSFYQEFRSEQALKILQSHLTSTIKVLRDNVVSIINIAELVPGDIIKLEPGDMVPADVRFVSSNSINLDESSLTGESSPVNKISDPLSKPADSIYTASNIGFMGTTVVAGSGMAIVLATAKSTQFGQISELTLKTVRESGFQLRLAKLSKFILCVVLITLVTLVVTHLLLKGRNVDIIQLLLFSLALTIGLTPEALPAVTTFALSRGALKLAQHNVIVKRLSAIEDLGAITLLCTDKTGTLTENVMSVKDIFMFNNEPVLIYGMLSSRKENITEAFDKATWAAANESDKNEEKKYERVEEIPFDPHKWRSVILTKKDNKYIIIARGAYEEIIKLCSNIAKDHLDQWIAKQAEEGNRILAIAYKTLSAKPENIESQLHDMSFAGLMAFQDPVKPTAIKAISKAHELGIVIKMITGDSKEIACNVAQKIGLSKVKDCAINGPEFALLSTNQKKEACQKYFVFSHISPEQKYEIVNFLRENNIVGFLGDGINDAPGLKAAHVAIVVQHASDIAKDAADIVLLKKSLSTIVEGIAIGRNIFSNTIKYIIAVLSSTFGNFYSVAIASLFTTYLPILPIQILLVNLISDLPMIAIATDTVDIDELKKPQAYNLKNIAFLAIILGLVSSVFDFIFFAFFFKKGAKVLQTNWFIESILTELMLIYSIRTKKIFWKATRPSFVLVSLSVIACLITVLLPSTKLGQEFFQFQNTNWHYLTIIICIVTAYFICTEIVKLLYYSLSTIKNNRH